MNIIRRGALVVALILAVAGTASAQFRFGIRAGIQTNSLHFNKSTFDSDNRVGFTGGVMAEFTVPVVGIGADLGLMYTHRSTDLMVATNEGVEEVDGRTISKSRSTLSGVSTSRSSTRLCARMCSPDRASLSLHPRRQSQTLSKTAVAMWHGM